MAVKKQITATKLDSSTAAKRLIRLAGSVTTLDAAIQILAERLLTDIPCPPTNLEAVFPQLNVARCEGEDIWGSGELRREGKQLAIVYNSSHSPARRRFTIGHELGHALLESTGPNCPRTGEHVERICDMFASELLMPRSIFLSYANGEVTVQKVMELSQIFQTSLMATAARFATLQKVAVFMANDEGIEWNFGPIRKTNLFSDIRDCIDKATNGEVGSDIVFLSERGNRGEWRLEWKPLGQRKQALFLAKPIRLYGNFASY